VALFERTGRGVRPTQAALALADAARQMEQASFALHQRLTQQQKGEAGTVRITASTTVATYLLPSVLARMQLDLPAIQVELVSSNAVSNLLRREADIALRSVQPDQSSVIARRVGKLTLGIYAHTRYLQQRGEPKSPEQLLNHTLLGNDQDTAIIDGLRRSGLTVDKSDFALRTDDFLAYWQLLRAGAGIGFVSDLLARTDAQVKPLLTAAKIPPLPLWLVVHREVRGNPRIKAVFDYLADAVPGLL
jgi:DNA-binding transcriptional LysR family regulator